MLQTRVHAYADTQNYRLGVNYQLLYINAPRCPFHNNHNDGMMNVTEKDEEVSCSNPVPPLKLTILRVVYQLVLSCVCRLTIGVA
jgi:catalase